MRERKEVIVIYTDSQRKREKREREIQRYRESERERQRDKEIQRVRERDRETDREIITRDTQIPTTLNVYFYVKSNGTSCLRNCRVVDKNW